MFGRLTALVAALVIVCGSASAQMSIPGKLSVDSGGATTYAIPIVVPPGVAGMTPALTLEYSSHAGNGLLGVGWSLGGLPTMTRCPQTMAQNGFRGGINLDGNDRFCLDGQQLVAISGNYGAHGTEYRTEIESFSRITSWGQNGNGPAWFEVQTRSGQIMQLGNSINSQVFAQCTPTIRAWLVNSVSDTRGNSFTVAYSNDTSSCGGTGQAYPASIVYTVNRVVFGYENRPDPIVSYQAGSLTRTTVRLTDIKTYAGSAPVADYQLSYQQGGVVPVSHVSSITLFGGDRSQPGTPALPPTTFGWSNNAGGTFSSGNQSTQVGLPNGGWMSVNGDFNGDGIADFAIIGTNASGSAILTFLGNANGTFTEQNEAITYLGPTSNWVAVGGDFNGDGLTDIAIVGTTNNNSAVLTFLRQTNGTFAGPYATNLSNIGPPTHWTAMGGDFNGDGLSDIIIVGSQNGSSGIYTLTSNGGGGFGISFQSIGNVDLTGWLKTTGDFNGDGLTDFVIVGGSAVLTYISNGSGFLPYGQTLPGNLGIPPSGYSIVGGDFNGDGKADFVLLGTQGGSLINTFIGRGNGYFDLVSQNVTTSGSLGITLSADFNGDGKSDFLFVSDDSIYTFFSNGDGTFASINQTNSLGLVGGAPVTGDFNGDGLTDFLFISGNVIFPYFNSGNAGDLLTSVTTGLGATTSIGYLPLTNGGVYARDYSTYPLLDFVGPFYVTSRIDAPNGVDGNPYRTTYFYAGAKTDLTGRGLLGFRQVAATDQQTGIVQTTNYSQSFPFIGLVTSATKTLGGLLLNQSINGYQFLNGNSAQSVSTPTTASAPYRVQLGGSNVQSADLDGTPMPTVLTGYNYDAYNNATVVDVITTQPGSATLDGYRTTTYTTYYNDVGGTNWLLGRLTGATVIKTTP